VTAFPELYPPPPSRTRARHRFPDPCPPPLSHMPHEPPAPARGIRIRPSAQGANSNDGTSLLSQRQQCSIVAVKFGARTASAALSGLDPQARRQATASFPRNVHNHGIPSPAPAGMMLRHDAQWRWRGPVGRATMKMSLLSAVGECVEALRSRYRACACPACARPPAEPRGVVSPHVTEIIPTCWSHAS